MASKAAIANVYHYLTEAYPDHLMAIVDIFVDILSDIPDDHLIAATRSYLRDGHRFPPNPGQLAQAAFDLEDTAAGHPTAPEAWEMVLNEVRRKGYYGVPELPELVWQSVGSVGGWRYLCHSENLVSDRARFLEAYQIFYRRERQIQRMHPAVRDHIRQLAADVQKRQLKASAR